MVLTRRQAALQDNNSTDKGTTKKRQLNEEQQPRKKARNSGTKAKDNSRAKPPKDGPAKAKSKGRLTKAKPKSNGDNGKTVKIAKKPDAASPWMPGTIERGHIYFFYRPKVQLEEVHSLDEVRNFQIVLVPRPPEFSTGIKHNGNGEDDEMNLISPGDDAVPADEPINTTNKKYRLILVGKKKLPDPEPGGKGKGRKETFWATVTKVGDDLDALEKGVGERTYETKTRGARHEAPVRLAGRGAYAIVNNDPRVPSGRETHLGYHISHPEELGDVQMELGIAKASSFVLQIRNPLAPAAAPGQVAGKGAEYPAHIMNNVFGKGGSKGRESYGLRFASCETTELLDYQGAQLLLIAARGGEDGLETSLGEGRGQKLSEKEQTESSEPVWKVFKELGIDSEKFPADALEGEWI